MSKRTNILITLIVALLMPNVVLAHRGDHRKIMKELNLTDKQKTQMEELRGKKAFAKEDRKKMRELREKFHDALKGKATDAELTTMHNEMQALKAKKAEGHFKHMLEVRKILTAEQRAKFHDLREKNMKKKWQDRDDDDDDDNNDKDEKDAGDKKVK